MRVYKRLPCGCLISTDGGGGLIPCCYPEVGDKESKLHKRCMRLYFKEGKTVEEIWQIVGKAEKVHLVFT